MEYEICSFQNKNYKLKVAKKRDVCLILSCSTLLYYYLTFVCSVISHGKLMSIIMAAKYVRFNLINNCLIVKYKVPCIRSWMVLARFVFRVNA